MPAQVGDSIDGSPTIGSAVHPPPLLIGPYEGSQFIIYGLCEPDTLEVRYVGLSRAGLKRPFAHSAEAGASRRSTHKRNWIRSLHRQRRNYSILVLEELATDEGIGDVERRVIAWFRENDARLVNITDGGEKGWTIDPHSMERFRELMARAVDPEHRQSRTLRAGIAEAASEFRRYERLREAELRYLNGDLTQEAVLLRAAGVRPEQIRARWSHEADVTAGV